MLFCLQSVIRFFRTGMINVLFSKGEGGCTPPGMIPKNCVGFPSGPRDGELIIVSALKMFLFIIGEPLLSPVLDAGDDAVRIDVRAGVREGIREGVRGGVRKGDRTGVWYSRARPANVCRDGLCLPTFAINASICCLGGGGGDWQHARMVNEIGCFCFLCG